ncbi:MAG: VWA domain-containing protein [Pseudomonadales bacterium]|nr:VWA domain-containing protein [Pseudomonadales bacterium]
MDFLPEALLANFHFLRPLWLLCLLPAALLGFYLWRVNEVSSAWDKAIDSSLLPWLLDKSKNVAQRTPLVLLLLVWTVSIIALAGPVWERIPQPIQKRQDSLVILLDLSLSLYATDLQPNRLTVAKRKLLDVLEIRREGQTGLVVYAGDAHTVTPLTEDTVTISALAPSLSPNIMPVFGSNPLAAIELALELLTDINASSGKLLLITDGVESTDANDIRNLLASSPYSLSILGIGTEQGAPIPASDGDFLRDDSGNVIRPVLNSNLLDDLANSLNGRYRTADLTVSDVEYLLADYDFRNDEALSESGENFDIWYETGPWLLLLILPLCALLFRRGWVLTLLFAVGTGTLLMPAPPAQAQDFNWQDLWKTRDQQAAESYANEDPETAAALFRSPQWKGSAAYHAGDFQTAIANFSQSDDVTSLYNLGNAYAKAELFEQAIQAYDAALAIENDHADALYNKAIVEDLLQQQEQEQQESQNAQNQEQQEQQEQESAQSEPDANETDPQEENNQNQDQSEQDQQQSESDQEQQQSDQNQDSQQQTAAMTEDQESLEQWLRRIEDDPGELLQRKFQFEYRRRQMENRNNNGNQAAGRQIW